MDPTRLRYLDFDYSEDTGEVGLFDAMASVWPDQLAALQAEVAAVLDWAEAAFAGRRGAIEDGFDWDYDLRAQRDYTVPETLSYDPAARRFDVEAGEPGPPRHTLTFSIGGTAVFCAALRAQFGLDDD